MPKLHGRVARTPWACGLLSLALLAGCGGADRPQAPEAGAASVAGAAASAPQRAQVLSAVRAGSLSAEEAAQLQQALASVRGDGQSLASLSPQEFSGAARVARHGSFGLTEALVHEVRVLGAPRWVREQMALDVSRYSSGRGDAIHRHTEALFFCDQPQHAGPNCWRDWFSAEPLVWDFYRNAVHQPDQLRQRVALALQQILVVSELEAQGTYGLRNYHNVLLANAFGNWRDLLRHVSLSPVMGEYLDNVNNDRLLPNENYARELLELFSIGPCLLQPDGRQTGGRCLPAYTNQDVRVYAFALTGWTYPPGGSSHWGCWPVGTNCPYLGGDMVPAAVLRNTAAQQLLSGVSVPQGASAPQALEAVLDSLMQHPNMAPFVARQLIQHLVMSNPSPSYVRRVAAAFERGRYDSSTRGFSFGDDRRGSLEATVAAVLLEPEAALQGARFLTPGQLREPVLLFTGVLRALNGTTDGAPFGWWWGQLMRQHLFRSPSVFNFYSPSFPVPGTDLVGPQFGIHNANTALSRLNLLSYLIDWDGSAPDPSVPGASGTRVDWAPFLPLADDPLALVQNLALLAGRAPLAGEPLQRVLAAVSWHTQATAGSNWRRDRARTAAYLVFASSEFHVTR